MQKPTVGRIVHYYCKGIMGWEGPFAAIVVSVYSETTVNLQIFPNHDDPMEYKGCVYPKPPAKELDYHKDYWEWPPRNEVVLGGGSGLI